MPDYIICKITEIILSDCDECEVLKRKGKYIEKTNSAFTFSEKTPSMNTLSQLNPAVTGNGVRMLMADAVLSAREISVCGVCCTLARAVCCRWLTMISVSKQGT